jgi:hypothetical protein
VTTGRQLIVARQCARNQRITVRPVLALHKCIWVSIEARTRRHLSLQGTTGVYPVVCT